MAHLVDAGHLSTDQYQQRIQSGLIAMMATAYFLTLNLPLLLLLTYDFAVRAFVTQKVSPFYLLSKFIVTIASLQPVTVDARPKLFATKWWFFLSLLCLYFTLSGDQITTLYLAALLVIAVATDAFVNVCIGCKLFQLLQRYNIQIRPLQD